MQLSPESTKEQKDALSEALFQHANRMGTIGAAPEDIPEGFAVPTYSENFRPLYDNQLFPAVSTVEDLVRVGYVTPDGQSTPEGDMAIALRESGGLNEDYTLNDAGRAMLTKREDLLEPENLNLYGKSEELNLDDDGRGTLERFSAGVQELWKSTKDLGSALYEEAELDYTPEQRAATRIRTEEALKGFSDQSVSTLLGAGELIARATAAGPFPVAQRQLMALTNAANKDEAVLITRQARERMLNNVANVSVSEAVDQLTGITEFVKSYKQAEEVLGPERTKEVQDQGAAMGLAASIANPLAPEAAAFGVGFKVAGKALAPISGSLLRAEQKASRVLAKTEDLTALQKQAAEYNFAIKTIEQQAARAEEIAAQLSKRGFVDRANSATTNANLIRRKAQETGVKLGGLQDEIARVSDDLATLTKDATVADKFNQMMQKAKEVPYLPITGIGTSLEYVGRGMIGIDKGLSKLASKVGVDKAYNAMNKISSLSGLGTVGAAAGLGPVAFIPAAIKAAWSTAPFIQGAGRFVNLVGKEAMKSRADIGFWKRIYQMPNQGPVNRAIAGFMDTATLGGRVTDLGVRTTKGVLAAVPADLAFQYVAEGGKMDAGSIGEALSESIFFGGAGSGLGAITMGSKRKIRSLQNGNALNFYRSLEDPNQRIMFNGMPEDYRRAIGTFSATNPGARVMFTTIGGGGIDPNTNTIYINPNSSNPIKPLVTHEFMHHMMNNGIGEGITAQLVGDGYQTGGLLRTADGKYEPQYEAFKEEYVDRLRQQHAQMIKMREAIGDKIPASEREFQPPNEKYLAEEYFIESNVEDMLGLVESGKFGKMAGRMVINDKVRALGDSILDKSSILRDLHFKLGGVMDKNGKMVSGNGFLGGQMYQSPEIRRMFKKMVSDSVGRKGGFDKARVKAKEGVKLKINSKSDPILKSMVSMWEGDVDGVPFLDKDGDFIPLKKETEEIRATAGLLLIDDQNRKQANGEAIEEGQLTYNPDTQTWSGKYLTEDQIRILKLSGRFNNPQIRQLEMLNEAARATLDPNAKPSTRGNRFSIIYQAALTRNKKGKWRYDQIEPSLRDVVPYGVEISKKGNISIRIMSTNQLHANISKKAASNNGIKLYEGNIEAILRDVNRVIELHGEADGKPTDAHFKEKYGSQWEEHKKFINSVFGNVGAGHKDINPLVASDKVDAVVKTYRLDRINKATQMVGSTNLPYQNNLVKINYLPEGEPILDANGEPKDLRYTPRYEERMPEQRQMPEVSPEDLNPVANKQEAQGLWADGKRMFALNEMDEKLTPITSKAMLDSYSADAIGWMEPEQATAPSQRFMPEKLDADYMKAVDSGDVGAQQRLVDEAAMESGFDPKPISRGRRSASGKIKSNVPYFTFNEQAAQAYAQEYGGDEGVVLKAYSKFKNTATEKQVVDVAKRINHQFVDEAFPSAYLDVSPKLVKALKEEGFDSVEGRDSLPEDQGTISVVAALYPESQIKSADPITSDDSGNIIPPSKRFDITSKDLRFMPESYRGEHTAPTAESAPASDLTSNGVYPADVYTRPDWYEQDDGLEEMRKIQRLKGKPDSLVWIHRAVPLDVAEKAMKSDSPMGYVFKSGDWVTTNKKYAQDHGESALNGKYRVFSKMVKAKDIYTNGDSIFEWGYNPEETEQAETMPAINQPTKTGQMRFLPEPVEKLSAFKGKRVQVLTSDLSLVGDVKYGDYTARFQGGPGYLDNDGWGFTDKDAADGFVTRWKRDGKPLIGLASLGSGNHLNSLESRKSYAEKWKYLIQSGKLNKADVDDHIKDAMSRIINSEAKKVKTDWVNAAKMIESADDLANYFDKIPWAAAPMFYEKLTAKTLPIKYSTLVENGLDLESVAREYRQPEYENADIGDLYAIAEYDGSEPEYSPDLNRAYPWRIKFKKKATLSEMHNVADLTTDPRAFTGKKVGAKLAPQPLMVTGVQLDKLMSGDIKPSGKPVSLKKDTPKTKSNKATEFSTGNPRAYKSYEQIMAERELEKPKPKKKSTAKGNSSAIANAAKLK